MKDIEHKQIFLMEAMHARYWKGIWRSIEIEQVYNVYMLGVYKIFHIHIKHSFMHGPDLYLIIPFDGCIRKVFPRLQRKFSLWLIYALGWSHVTLY